MMRFITPIFIVIAAAGIFFYLTDPIIHNPLNLAIDGSVTGGGIVALRDEKDVLNTALANAHKLEAKIEELRNQYNKVSKDDQDKLNKFLPDHVDNVQLIVDIANLAEQNGLTLKDIKIVGDDATAGAPTTIVKNVAGLEQGSVGLSFTVNGSYDHFQTFLGVLAQSLRVVDITSIEVSVADTGVYQYNVQLKTYWLK